MDAFEEMIKRLEADQNNNRMDNQSMINKNAVSNLESITSNVGLAPQQGAVNASNNGREFQTIANTGLKSSGLSKSVTSGLKDAKNEVKTENLADIPNKSFDVSKVSRIATGALDAVSGLATNLRKTDGAFQPNNTGALGYAAKAASGFAKGSAMGGPLVGAGMALAEIGTTFFGEKAAMKKFGKKQLERGGKETAEKKAKLDQEYMMQEGQARIADLKALRKRQLGIPS